MTTEHLPRRYEVYQYEGEFGSRLLAVLFYAPTYSAREVRRGLIAHAGYPESISVYRCKENRVAFDDVARSSHPEEH